MNYEFSKRADKQLQKLPVELQRRIIRKIKFYLNSESPLHFADSISGEDQQLYRFRIGTYRVIFELIDNTIHVLKLKHIKEVYKK